MSLGCDTGLEDLSCTAPLHHCITHFDTITTFTRLCVFSLHPLCWLDSSVRCFVTFTVSVYLFVTLRAIRSQPHDDFSLVVRGVDAPIAMSRIYRQLKSITRHQESWRRKRIQQRYESHPDYRYETLYVRCSIPDLRLLTSSKGAEPCPHNHP